MGKIGEVERIILRAMLYIAFAFATLRLLIAGPYADQSAHTQIIVAVTSIVSLAALACSTKPSDH